MGEGRAPCVGHRALYEYLGFSALLKGTRAVLRRCSGTSPTTRTSIICLLRGRPSRCLNYQLPEQSCRGGWRDEGRRAGGLRRAVVVAPPSGNRAREDPGSLELMGRMQQSRGSREHSAGQCEAPASVSKGQPEALSGTEGLCRGATGTPGGHLHSSGPRKALNLPATILGRPQWRAGDPEVSHDALNDHR